MEVNGEMPSYIRIGGQIVTNQGEPIITNQKIQTRIIFDDNLNGLLFKEYKFHRTCFFCNKMKNIFYDELDSGFEYCVDCADNTIGYNK